MSRTDWGEVNRELTREEEEELSREKVEEELYELPPSPTLVWYVLNARGGMERQELLDETPLSARTVDDAVSTLQERGIADRRYSLRDSRKRIIELEPSYRLEEEGV